VRPSRSLVTLAFVSLLVAATSRADARGPSAAGSVDVAWSAPAECPTSEELRRRVVASLPPDVAVRARGVVDKRAGRYKVMLDVETADARGERALEAPSCDALASSVAVVVAISAAKSDAPARPSPAAAGATSTPAAGDETAAVDRRGEPARELVPANVAPTATADAPPVAAAPRSSRVRPLVRAEAAATSGILPTTAVGGGITIGAVLAPRLSVEATASLWASQDATVPTAPGRGASFDLFSAAARACWSLTHGVELAPCVGLGIARLGSSGFGAARVSDATGVLAGPEASLTVLVPVTGALSVRAGVTGFVPIARQSFVIQAAGTVHRPDAVAVRGFLGPEVRF